MTDRDGRLPRIGQSTTGEAGGTCAPQIRMAAPWPPVVTELGVGQNLALSPCLRYGNWSESLVHRCHRGSLGNQRQGQRSPRPPNSSSATVALGALHWIAQR